ncbi:MAG: CRTAC1 family protein [Planctomycetes bacterium]|nr:CRTAC1 family protein [Planctomycetota bacterium]
MRLAALLLLLAACGSNEPAPAPVDAAPFGAAFSDATGETGITFVHESGASERKWLPETMGSGVLMLDHDGDGDTDLLFPSRGSTRLWRNEGGWRFTDVTAESGIDAKGYAMGGAVADYDADGDPDVYLTCLDGNLLCRNDGGRFVRVPGAPSGGAWGDPEGEFPSWSTAAAWLDADGDGDLDLVVVNYVRWAPHRDVHAEVVEGEKAYTRPQLYEGDRDETPVAGKSLGLCVDDFDGDGRTDLFVANDTVQNFLFLGTGPARWREAALERGVAFDDAGAARAAMGVDSADWRNDGSLAIAVGNFSDEPLSLFAVEEGRFRDEAAAAGLLEPTRIPLTFGVLFRDLDLDGRADLVLANGHIEPSIGKLRRELLHAQVPQIFRNLGAGRFREVPVPPRPIVGRGLAAGDLDGDGDLDLVLTSNGGAPLLLRNDIGNGHRGLRLRLRQPGSRNRDAIGATVVVRAGGLARRDVVRTGSSYLSGSEPVLTFGLGSAAGAEVGIVWPDGMRQDLRLAAGPQVQVVERR